MKSRSTSDNSFSLDRHPLLDQKNTSHNTPTTPTFTPPRRMHDSSNHHVDNIPLSACQTPPALPPHTPAASHLFHRDLSPPSFYNSGREEFDSMENRMPGALMLPEPPTLKRRHHHQQQQQHTRCGGLLHFRLLPKSRKTGFLTPPLHTTQQQQASLSPSSSGILDEGDDDDLGGSMMPTLLFQEFHPHISNESMLGDTPARRANAALRSIEQDNKLDDEDDDDECAAYFHHGQFSFHF